MDLLENLKEQAHKAYEEALSCSDNLKRQLLLEKYHQIYERYQKQKIWIQVLES